MGLTLLFRLLPVRDWLYIAAIVAITAASALFIHHERGVGASKVEAVRQAEHAQAAAVAASAIATNQAETARRVAAVQESAHVAESQASAALSDAAAARAAADRLRDRLAAAGRRPVSQDPAASAASPPAPAATGVPPELFSSLLDLAGRYAADADNARIAGSACERAYDALTTNPAAASAP